MPYKILIADDDAGYRYPLRHLFEDFTYEVCEAADYDGVIERAPECDIWIIDVRLPTRKQEGILAVHELARNRNNPPRHPVIFISVLGQSFCTDNLLKLEKLGVQYVWIEKPFELELLLTQVNRLIREASKNVK